jgi:hypothetical protein
LVVQGVQNHVEIVHIDYQTCSTQRSYD